MVAAVVQRVIESVGGIVLLVLAIGLVVGVVWLKRYNRQKRFEFLCKKYGDPEMAQRIIARSFWQGQTASQLADALGTPANVDTKIMKTKTREIWKYDQRSRTRYGLRITLEDGFVVGWDQK